MTIVKFKFHGRDDLFYDFQEVTSCDLEWICGGIHYCPPPPVIHAQNPISVDSQEIDVESRESNEEFLNYLELVDYFVTAERIPSNRWDTPANVTVITSQEIEDNHYQTVAEALSHVNGVYISEFGRRDTIGYVNINGTNRVLLLIDGHRINISQDMRAGENGTISNLGVIPSVKTVDRIEIVKGSASALYGSDAIGGVINIVTKKGTRNETEVDMSWGSWNRQKYEITNQGVKDKLNWFVTAGLGKSKAAERPATDYVSAPFENTEYEDRDISIRLEDKFSDRNSLNVSYMNQTHDFYKINREVKFTYRRNSSNYMYYTFLQNASIEYRFKENTSTPGWIRYFNVYQKGQTDSSIYFSKSTLQGLEYQNGWELGDHHKLIAGLEGHRVESQCEAFGYDENRNDLASYLQDTISLGNKLTIIPGVRYDYGKEYGGNWSPKIAVNYRADDKTKFYASWGRNYRIPSIGELFSNYSWFGRIYVGSGYDNIADLINEKLSYPQSSSKRNLASEIVYFSQIQNLKPEKGQNKTFGVEHDFDDKKSIALNVFYNQVDNAVVWDTLYTDSREYVNYSYNKPQLKNRGVEVTYRQKVNDHWSFDVGFSQATIETSHATFDYDTFLDTNGQPKGYRAGIHYKCGSWRANLLGIMASGRRYNRNPEYAVFDFNASYDFTDRATMYLCATNFTDELYSNSSSSSYNYAPGRFFQIGATYKF